MPTAYEKVANDEDCELEPYADGVPITPVRPPHFDHEELSEKQKKGLQIKRKVIRFLAAFLTAIVPSFLHGSLKKSDKANAVRKSNITTLDGLRGLSCLFVLNSHWTYTIVDSYRGTTGYKNSHWFFHLPIIHLLWGGQALVDIFFVLSGYVLSCKCIKQIHASSWEAFHKTVASAVIRRGTRIWLPPIISICIVFVLSRLHAFDRAHEITMDQHFHHTYQLELRDVPPQRFDSFWFHFVDFLGAVLALLDPTPVLKLENFRTYNGYLWTIPLEYYCSMVLYVVMIGTSRLKKSYRLAIHGFLTGFYWFNMHRFQCLFIAGMTLAELDILWNNHQKEQDLDLTAASPSEYRAQKSRRCSTSQFKTVFKNVPWITWARSLILFCGLWLLSVPGRAAEDTPGYETIMKLLPSYFDWNNAQHLVRAAGSIFVVWPIANVSTDSTAATERDGRPLPWWSFKKLVDNTLTNPVVHYLGQISFALYILHGLVIKSIGYSILPAIYKYVVFDSNRRDSFKGWPGKEYINGTWVKTPVNLKASGGSIANLGGSSSLDTRASDPYNVGLTSLEIALIWILGYLVVLPCTIWAADVFWRLIDQRCITLGHKLEQSMSVVVDKKITPSIRQFDTPTRSRPRWQSQGGGGHQPNDL